MGDPQWEARTVKGGSDVDAAQAGAAISSSGRRIEDRNSFILDWIGLDWAESVAGSSLFAFNTGRKAVSGNVEKQKSDEARG